MCAGTCGCHLRDWLNCLQGRCPHTKIVVFAYVYWSGSVCACSCIHIWALHARWCWAKDYSGVCFTQNSQIFKVCFVSRKLELWVLVYAPVYLFLQIHSALKVITIYITESPTSATTFKSLAVILYKLPFLLASYSLSSYLQLQSTYHSSIFMLISTSVYAVQRFTSVLLEKYITHFVFIKH